MKLVLSAITAITVVSFFGSPGKTLAGLRAEERFGPQGNGSDALFIYASGSTLDRVINTDTTSTGQQAHSVYELVSLDTTYIYLGQISPREDITVLGVLGSDGRPPCIQPGVLNDGSIPNVLFNLNRSGLVGTFKNLYVEVENNDFYEPAAVTNFWTEWDDTAKGADSLYTASWMNARTTHMFNDPTDWPGFKESENMIGTDPGYGASFANVFQGGSNYGIGLLKYFTLIRTLQSPTVGWGYQIPSIPAGTTNWIPDRPLPEAADMQYRNAALMSGGTDGKPLGDPGWFTGGYTGVKQHSQTVPTGFILSNNYPNPFNPSTVIKVSLNRSGAMSLRIYNVLGQQVKVVDQGNKAPGEYIYGVNMDNFASGVYFYTLEQRPNIMTKKMLLLK